MLSGVEKEKQRAAQAAAQMVEDGMTVGLGTGTTVAYLLPALATRQLSLRCVATSDRTEQAATELGLRVERFTLERLDIAIDGADQISPDGWLVKGGGGAHTREKLVAVTADRFVVIADSTKPVATLHPPIPLELVAFGLESTLARIGTVRLRDIPPSPDGGVIADFTGAVGEPGALAARLEATPGVVEHGLFPPDIVTTIFVARGESVQRIDCIPS
jgi:ribose 5-phosphate isomerase A